MKLIKIPWGHIFHCCKMTLKGTNKEVKKVHGQRSKQNKKQKKKKERKKERIKK